MDYIPKKTIYDITHDELEFLYHHSRKLKEYLAVTNNLNFMLKEENKYLRDKIKKLENGYHNKE
jgi:hypothetical protein